ncbi:hypothetical protein RB195_024568 [Necator americanus]|uniref:Neurotransmitter-gated ion-channel transmembrane domain-containing protein n=1 Tax=Necator americanus TaxID=51031 RepID=A0ABR1EPD3_NECAM
MVLPSRRRTTFYLFNIVLPSLVVSLMTLVGFCLPAHDMSEKIGYQTTILLSICFFVTIVSEMTPTTSESVPLLGIFFSTLTLIVSVSTTFTITVLHFRYRQPQNARMTLMFRSLFLDLLPRLTLLRRPKQSRPNLSLSRHSASQLKHFGLSTNNMTAQPSATATLREARTDSYKLEQLHLRRKVGAGILRSRSVKRNCPAKQKTNTSFRFLMHCSAISTQTTCSIYKVDFAHHYFFIRTRLKKIRERIDRTTNVMKEQEDWKFAALALDRLCMIIFTLLITLCLASITSSSPYFHT